jgi:hypothetical protein
MIDPSTLLKDFLIEALDSHSKGNEEFVSHMLAKLNYTDMALA